MKPQPIWETHYLPLTCGDSSIGRTTGFQPVGLGSSPSRRSQSTVASAVERGCTHKTVPRTWGSNPHRCSDHNKAGREWPERGEMPKENFYCGNQVQGDGQEPDFSLAWGGGEVYLNGVTIASVQDYSGLLRFRRSLNRAITHLLDSE